METMVLVAKICLSILSVAGVLLFICWGYMEIFKKHYASIMYDITEIVGNISAIVFVFVGIISVVGFIIWIILFLIW